MKIGSFIACLVPELRKMSGAQLLRVWEGVSSQSRYKIYLHCVVLLACSSAIFNLFMWWGESLFMDVLGLVVGLTVPPNVYFFAVFNNRRAQIQKFMQENWEEFRPE